MLSQQAGQGAKIHITAVVHAGGGHGPLLLTPLHHERQPVAYGGRIFGVIHLREQRMLRQGLVAIAQIVDGALALDPAQMGDAVDEAARMRQYPALHQGAPELQRLLKAGIDAQGALNGDLAIALAGGVVEFTVAGVAGAGVVPGIGTLAGEARGLLYQGDVTGGIELAHQGGQGLAHNAAADQQHVCLMHPHTAASSSSQVWMAARLSMLHCKINQAGASQ